MEEGPGSRIITQRIPDTSRNEKVRLDKFYV
jgi:hypothetical protein